jgi:hypothetical protein
MLTIFSENINYMEMTYAVIDKMFKRKTMKKIMEN